MARTAHLASWLAIAAAALWGCAGELDEAFQPVDTPLSIGGSSAGGGGPVESSVFRPDIQVDLQVVGCIGERCHGDQGVAMVVVANPSSSQEWQTNYEQVRERGANQLLLTKPTGAFDHPVVTLEPGHPILREWAKWVEDGMPFTEEEE